MLGFCVLQGSLTRCGDYLDRHAALEWRERTRASTKRYRPLRFRLGCRFKLGTVPLHLNMSVALGKEYALLGL